ncbi:hypothetical protein HZB93_03035 [Candidatus Falkowbacteria bacterium]|nr:hypothetical protein [Candidatus Falkowbacteria bacterium]
MAETSLDIIIKTVDQASKELDKVKSALSGIDKTTSQFKSTQTDLTKSVFAGIASWDILKKAIHATGDFLRESVKLAMESQVAWAGLEQSVKNVGLNATEVVPQIKSYAEEMQNLGFDGEQTAQSMNILISSTGNLNKAFELNKVAMEIASFNLMSGRTQTLDLGNATEQLNLILTGGAKVAKRFGIDIKDVGTQGELLKEILKKVGDSSEKMSKTAQGAALIMKIKFEDLKKEIGNNFIQSVGAAQKSLQILASDPAVENFVKKSSKLFGGFTADMVRGATMAVSIVVNFGKATLDAFKSAVSTAGAVLKDFFTGKWGEIGGEITKYSDGVSAKWKDAFNNIGNSWKGLEETSETASTNVVNNLDDFAKGIGSSTSSAKNNFSELKDKIKDFGQSSADALNETVNKISELSNSLNELYAGHTKEEQGLGMDYAEAYVKQEEKVNDLKKQVSMEGDTSKRIELQNELLREQQALNTRKTVEMAYHQQIEDVRKQHSMTEFERTLADLQMKQQTMNEEFESKKKNIEDQLKVELERYKIMEDIRTQAQKLTEKFLLEGELKTVESINREIARYNELAKAISAAKSGFTSSQISAGSINTQLQSLKDKGTNMPNITINITGNTLLDSKAAETIGNKIVDKVKSNIKI